MTQQHQKKEDNLSNLLTGLGTEIDKSEYSVVVPGLAMGVRQLEILYANNGMARRIVDRLVDDATRVTWNLKGSDQSFDWKSVKSQLDDLEVMGRLAENWKSARIYGGSLAVLAANDGRPYHEPLDLDKVRVLWGISVVPSVYAIPEDWDPGLGSSAFAEPQSYQMVLPLPTRKSTTKVHASRVIRMDGVSMPMSVLLSGGSNLGSMGWGPSLLQSVWAPLRRLMSALKYAENIMHELSIPIVKMKEFSDQLCGGNVSEVRQAIANLKMMMDSLHLLVVDSEDSVEEFKRSVDGLDKLIDKFVDDGVRQTSYPRTILLGEQPGGINTNAEGEVRAYYDAVEAERGVVLTPALNRILEVLFAVRRNRGEAVPSEWEITYESLMRPDPAKQAEITLKAAQASQILISTGVISPQEARGQLEQMGLVSAAEDLDMQEEETAQESAQAAPDEVQDEEGEEGPIPSAEPVPDDLCSPREAGERWGVPTRSITILIDRGELRYWQVGSRRQVSMADIQELSTSHWS